MNGGWYGVGVGYCDNLIGCLVCREDYAEIML